MGREGEREARRGRGEVENVAKIVNKGRMRNRNEPFHFRPNGRRKRPTVPKDDDDAEDGRADESATDKLAKSTKQFEFVAFRFVSFRVATSAMSAASHLFTVR